MQSLNSGLVERVQLLGRRDSDDRYAILDFILDPFVRHDELSRLSDSLCHR